MKTYLNNAGAGLMSDKTFATITDFLALERERGAYHAADDSQNSVEKFYANAARLLNASDPSEIAFVDSASRGWNMLINGVELRAGDRILTLSTEFGTNLITIFKRARDVGASVHVIPCDSAGTFSMTDVETQLRNGVRVIAISHAAAHGSIVNPVISIGELAKKYGATYIVDGCQAIGQLEVDVQAIQCDAYVGTGRKWLRGPRGTGLLYVRNAAPFHATQLDLASADLVFDKNQAVEGIKIRPDARQFELWERSIACMLGLSSAIEECLETSVSVIAERVQLLSNRLRAAVVENPNLCLIGNQRSESGIVGFFLNDPSREDQVRSMIGESGLRISTMGDWDCPMHFPRNGATLIFRFSPHYYTDESIVITACELLSRL